MRRGALIGGLVVAVLAVGPVGAHQERKVPYCEDVEGQPLPDPDKAFNAWADHLYCVQKSDGTIRFEGPRYMFKGSMSAFRIYVRRALAGKTALLRFWGVGVGPLDRYQIVYFGTDKNAAEWNSSGNITVGEWGFYFQELYFADIKTEVRGSGMTHWSRDMGKVLTGIVCTRDGDAFNLLSGRELLPFDRHVEPDCFCVDE